MAQERIDTLVLDCLHRTRIYPTHFSFQASMNFTKRLQPSQVYFIGMSHDFDHEATSIEFQKLSKEIGVELHLARDGLTLSFADFM
jgi:phosphoribosyl 1,2-cyclic phosphodiesterase